MIEITEQEVMDALDELMKAGKVRSFVKEGGDPLTQMIGCMKQSKIMVD